jgi:hypothetical protein
VTIIVSARTGRTGALCVSTIVVSLARIEANRESLTICSRGIASSSLQASGVPAVGTGFWLQAENFTVVHTRDRPIHIKEKVATCLT